MKKTFLLLVYLSSLSSFAQQQMVLRIFNQANTPAFTTNVFRSIGAGKGGHIWTGTANLGLYKYNGTVWEKSTTALTNHKLNFMYYLAITRIALQ